MRFSEQSTLSAFGPEIRMDTSTIKTLLNNDADANAQKIGFLLLNQFSLLAFASAIEPLRAANRQSGRQIFEWMVASPSGISSVASNGCLLYTSPSPRDRQKSRMPSSA